MKWFNQLKSYWYLLRVALVLGCRSTIIILHSWTKPRDFRNFVNQCTQTGAKKIMDIVKANYSIEYINPDAIDKNATYIFMSNHQSLLDIPLVYATIPGTVRFVTKAELFRIPIFGKAMQAGECIPLERKNPDKYGEFIAYAKAKLKNGVSLWFFPEGTRSKSTTMLPFKTGGFRLASDTQTQIVPVAIINTISILPTKSLALSLYTPVQVRVGEPIEVGAITSTEALNVIVTKVRNAIERLMQ